MFLRLLESLCRQIEEIENNFDYRRKGPGRPSFPLSDILFCCILKVYTGFSSRRFMSEAKMAKERGFTNNIPHFNSISNHFRNPELGHMLKFMIEITSYPFANVENIFAIDATGISTTKYRRWFDFKYGKEASPRRWIKIHMACGVKTKIIPAVEITNSRVADTTPFRSLITKLNENFHIKEILTDKAYSSRKNFEIVDKIGAIPYIPFKKNSKKYPRGCRLWKQMWVYFTEHEDEFNEHYHKRSIAESTFHMIKSKFGSSLRSKSESGQKNETMCKVICHNICVNINELFKIAKIRKEKEINHNTSIFQEIELF